MRKRHQAILISSQAKKKICNELSINNASYEIEQKQMLNNYFKDHIDDEDVEVPTNNKKIEENITNKVKVNGEEDEEENENEDDLEDEEEENITLSTNIAVPPLGDQKGPYVKYEISEKAFIGGINFDDYSYIPENKLKIKVENNEDDKKKYKNFRKNAKKEEKKEKDDGNIFLKVGAHLNFNNIIEQMAYWAEELSSEKSKDKNKNKKKAVNVEIPDINILQLLKLYPYKINEISDKIKILEKEARDKNLLNENSVVKSLLNDQENIINEKKQNINKLAKEFDRIHSITYGDNFSVIEFK
jgi:hypothetical protein